MTGTVKRSLGVGAVSINMTVMGVETVVRCQGAGEAFVDICKDGETIIQ